MKTYTEVTLTELNDFVQNQEYVKSITIDAGHFVVDCGAYTYRYLLKGE
jgi:hypothetical protein